MSTYFFLVHNVYVGEKQDETYFLFILITGTPKIEMAEHGDHKIIKCTAASNRHPPELSWLLSGIEIEGKIMRNVRVGIC